jgi:hypothetical protein
MTPLEVVSDAELLRRFQRDAYLDRPWPTDAEQQLDSEIARTSAASTVVAWLWPVEEYETSIDFFASAREEDRVLWADEVGEDSHDATERLERASRAIDRRREKRRQIPARRFRRIVAASARAIGRSTEELETHLSWSIAISQPELDRLKHGVVPFSIPLIDRLCASLTLEFDDGWFLSDPRRLAFHVERSVEAAAISEKLRHLTRDNLASLAKRLPRRVADPDQSPDLATYRAPEQGARYAALYEELAANKEIHPRYSRDQISQILIDAGEQGLPDSAKERSWWAGSGANSEGRPQVNAWWGAGYRVGHLAVAPATNEVASIEFEAIPGRADWFLSRPPGLRGFQLPAKKIYIDEYRADRDKRLEAIASTIDPKSFREVLDRTQEIFGAIVAYQQSQIPNDPDIRELVDFLEGAGEADRSQIEDHLSQIGNEASDTAWLTNLLTRARRNGWIFNKGTRKQPQWAAIRRRTMLLDDLAESRRLERPVIGPDDPVPTEFLRNVAETANLSCTSASAAQIARQIVESKGSMWRPEFESADGSVTTSGLKAIQDAVGMLMPPEDEIITLN